ncbi:MAG: hypothetical protein WC326_09010 [Candidatus Delongbacteria bacterium]
MAEELGFSWREQGDDELAIQRHGSTVTVLRGAAARRARAQLAGLEADAVQQLLARLTGNYRRGNEGVAARHPRNR